MEQEVLEKLYERYYVSTLLYCLALCGERTAAEDLAADAFVKAYLSLPDECPSFQYWLLRVCKNLWIDRLRRERKFVPLSAQPSMGEDPEEGFFKTERSRALWHAMAKLAPADREIVTLHYYVGLPLGEIAYQMGKSPTAIRQRLVRLRRKLKEEMEDKGYGI